MSRGPFVGITTRSGDPGWVERNTRRYLDVLERFGARPVVLSPDTSAVFPDGSHFTPDSEGRLPAAALDGVDGLLLSGGGDVHPRFFGAEIAGADPSGIDEARDVLEIDLIRLAVERDLPLFGICRGCQVMNVAMGGGMIQHLDGHRSGGDSPVLHGVSVVPGSRLHSIVGITELEVNSYHHQGLDRTVIAPGPAAAAFAGTLIEGIELPGSRWVLGVQWHPERLDEIPPAHRLIWESFLSACAR